MQIPVWQGAYFLRWSLSSTWTTNLSLALSLLSEVCNNSYFLAQSGECVEHCPDGEYEVGTEELGRVCMRCPSGFNRCISAKYASECNNHLWLGFWSHRSTPSQLGNALLIAC